MSPLVCQSCYVISIKSNRSGFRHVRYRRCWQPTEFVLGRRIELTIPPTHKAPHVHLVKHTSWAIDTVTPHQVCQRMRRGGVFGHWVRLDFYRGYSVPIVGGLGLTDKDGGQVTSNRLYITSLNEQAIAIASYNPSFKRRPRKIIDRDHDDVIL